VDRAPEDSPVLVKGVSMVAEQAAWDMGWRLDTVLAAVGPLTFVAACVLRA
jgi:hypothetical protein